MPGDAQRDGGTTSAANAKRRRREGGGDTEAGRGDGDGEGNTSDNGEKIGLHIDRPVITAGKKMTWMEQ